MEELTPPLEPESRNWKLTVAYDGTPYNGWQVQPGLLTVQGELQAALRRITGEAPLPQGSGRTDAGVHALGQVASFELSAPIPAENLLRALNRTLPASIRILEARTVRSTFHARHSAKAKTYLYRVYQGAICPPFLAPSVYACSLPFDFNKLNEAARAFVGEHDFFSFMATDPDLSTRSDEQPLRSTVRTIYASEWTEQRLAADLPEFSVADQGSLLVYRVRGNGFLHHMVRNLVGTMLDAARGQIDPEAMAGILAARSRSAAGPTAPARGLFLQSVEYDS